MLRIEDAPLCQCARTTFCRCGCGAILGFFHDKQTLLNISATNNNIDQAQLLQDLQKGAALKMSDDDEFDLPNAEEYFTALEAKVNTTHPQALPEDDASEELDDDLDHDTASHACLGLPEILERIIQFVPPLEVYRLQRVSTIFRDLISRSIPIRRHMYFVPENYFVRSELNELLGFQEYSKLGEAISPFRIRLYAHKDRIGASIEIDPRKYLCLSPHKSALQRQNSNM